MALLLKGARCVDPSVGLDEVCDMVVRDGRIVETGRGLSIEKGVERDYSGCVILPGLMDMHVHLREPGQEYKEDIASGCAAAAAGGFTAVLAMPNTKPTCDNGAAVAYVLEKAASVTRTRVYAAGALSAALAGNSLAEMGDMAHNGAIAFTDDGRGVQDAGMMRRAMDYAKQFGTPVLSHCQDEGLVADGMVNEGLASTRLGLAGWPAAGEEIQIARDIALCRLTGCRLHIQHVSTARGARLVQAAKDEGLPVTCEVTPHHLLLCEDDIGEDYDTSLKMNPPLRTREDMEALQEALATGVIDCVASDHAPHARHEKSLEFELAPFGTIGLESAVGVVLTALAALGRRDPDGRATTAIDWGLVAERMAHAPRRILGIDPVALRPGCVADLTVIDPAAVWVVGEDAFFSRSNNSAFAGRSLTGRVRATYVAGYATFEDGRLCENSQYRHCGLDPQSPDMLISDPEHCLRQSQDSPRLRRSQDDDYGVFTRADGKVIQ